MHKLRSSPIACENFIEFQYSRRYHKWSIGIGSSPTVSVVKVLCNLGKAKLKQARLISIAKKISVTHRLASTLQCFLTIEMTIKLVTMCYSNAAKSWTTATLIGKPSANWIICHRYVKLLEGLWYAVPPISG